MEKGNLSIQLRLEALLTEREAMFAANQQRLSQEEAVAYDFSHFDTLASQISELEDEIRENNESTDKNKKELLSEIRQLKEENNILRSDRDTYRNFALSLDKTVTSLQKAVKKLEDENEELTPLLQDLEQQNEKLQEKVEDGIRENNESIDKNMYPILEGFVELYKQLDEKNKEIAFLKAKVKESRELYQVLNKIHDLVEDTPSVCDGCGEIDNLTCENTEYSDKESGRSCVCENCYGFCYKCGEHGQLVDSWCENCHAKLQGGVN